MKNWLFRKTKGNKEYIETCQKQTLTETLATFVEPALRHDTATGAAT